MLLVSPSFHGYHASIAAALTDRGHSVTTHVYDNNGGARGRAWHQLRHQLPHKLGAGAHRGLRRETTGRAELAVRRTRPQVVVVIKGDTLGDAFWDSIARLPRVTWLYDEIRRTQWSTERLAGVGPIATYSRLDDIDFTAAGLDSRHLPLAFDHRLVAHPTSRRTGDITFIGARYATRERVLQLLNDHGLPIRAYGRDWSGHPFDRLRTWRIGTPDIPSGRDLARASAYDVMASSAATLNLHGDQDGFTMRTFEAAGVGGVELLDRSDGGELYEPGTEVLPWTTSDELISLCRRVLIDKRWAEAVRVAARRRTLAEHTFDQRVAVLESTWDLPVR